PGLITTSAAAAFYVRISSKKSGAATRWPTSCIVIGADSRGNPDLPEAEVDLTLAKSTDNWTHRTSLCSYLQLSVLTSYTEGDVSADNRPQVVFRTQWHRSQTDVS